MRPFNCTIKKKFTSFLFFVFCISCKENSEQEVITIDPELQLLTEAVELYPTSDSLVYKRAVWNYTHSDLNQAELDIKYAIKLDSLVPEYYHLLADIHLDNNHSYEAVSTMKEAALLFPDRIQTLLKLSEFQNIIKQYDESIKTSARIFKLDPFNAEAYFMTALNYRDLKDTSNAIISLQKATTYDDQLTDGWLLLAKLTQKTKPKEADQYIHTVLRLDTLSVATLHAAAEYFQESDPLKAIGFYKKIIEKDPSYIQAIVNAGIVYFSIDSFSQAINHFDIAIQQEPANARLYYSRGTVREANGDIAGAQQDYKQAIVLDPDNKEYSGALKQVKF